MEKTLELKSRLNSTFGILSLFSVVSGAISIISAILYFIAQIIIDGFSLGEAVYLKSNFYCLFIIPQFLLPISTALLACLIPVIGKFKFRSCIKKEKVPAVYSLLCVLIFPGLSTVFSYISYLISELLNMIGIPVGDINSAIPTPNGLGEIFLLFFVMAVLPAICEELIYRGFVLTGLSEYGKVGAVVVSSIAFGLMHATVQQIPFAFAIGLFLGYIAIRFNSIVLPMVLHFINNFIACFFMVLQEYVDNALLNNISLCVDIFFVAVSVLALAIFIILSVHEKKDKVSMFQIDSVNIAEYTKDSPGYTKADFLSAVMHSWGFWLFTVIYLFTTVINIAVMQLSI